MAVTCIDLGHCRGGVAKNVHVHTHLCSEKVKDKWNILSNIPCIFLGCAGAGKRLGEIVQRQEEGMCVIATMDARKRICGLEAGDLSWKHRNRAPTHFECVWGLVPVFRVWS